MADNVNITQGTGTIIAADDIAGVLHQRVKLSQGADGAAVDVSSAAPLNVTLANTGANATPIVVDLGANNDVTVASLPLPTGAATSALQTQPGVDIGDVTINNAAGASAVNIQDGGNSITVDGTVAVSGTVTVASHAVTNAGTFVVQENGAALTALQLIDDTIATLGTTTYTEASTKGAVIGAVRRDANTSLVDTTNEVAPLQVNATGELKVAQIQALPTGANTIGAVNIAAAQTLATVTTVGTVTTLTGTTTLTPGTGATNLGKARDTAIGATDTGVAILGVRRDAPTAETPAAGDYIVPQYSANGEAWVRTAGELADDAAFTVGTTRVQPVGYLADSTSTDSVDEGDIGAARMTLDRKQIVQPYADPVSFVSGAITSAMTGTTSTSLVAAPGAGLRNYLTTIIVSNAHATVGTDVVIQDGSGGTTLLTIPAAAVYGGAVITLPTPLRQPTTATAIFCANVTTGASTKVSAVGYTAA